MSKYSIEDTTLTAIGDAIRAKEQSEDSIPVVDIASRIEALSIGTEEKVLTPEEVYELYRDPAWPVLPDPESGETYALITTWKQSTLLKVVLPAKQDATDTVDVGWINEQGEYEVLYSTTPGSTYWAPTGLSDTNIIDKLYPYAILRTSNDQNMTTSVENVSSNEASNNEYSGHVLEMKVNSNNTKYFSADGSYPAKFPNLEFITFYNESFASNVSFKMYNFVRLKTVIFKGQNPIADPTFKSTGSFSNLFYGCNNLLAVYPLKGSATGQSLFGNCWCLPSLTIDFSERTTAPEVPILTGLLTGSWYQLRELYIDNPFNSNSTVISNSYPASAYGLKIKKLNCPLCSATTTALPPDLVEMLNVDYKFNMSSSGPARGLLKRITMAPTMTRSCGTMRIKSYVMTKEDLQEWFESLPVLSGETGTLVLTDIKSLTNHDIDDVIAIATDKGYTVTR